MRFYDLKNRKSFETDDYEIRNRGSRTFAVATTENGTECWKIMKSQEPKLRLNR